MAGLLSTAGTTSAAAGLTNAYFGQLINQLVAVERQPVTRLQSQRDQLQVRRSVYDQVDTKLSSLETLATDLAAGTASIFGAKTVTSDDTTVLTATASSSASPAVYDVSITTLAQAHRVRSDQQTYSDQALGLSGTFVIGGAASRSVANPVTVANTVDGFGTASVTSGLTELGTNTYYVEVRDNSGTDEFRVVDSEGNAVAIDDASAAGTTTTAGWQALSLVQGSTFDTGRGLTITFGSGPVTYGTKGSGAAGVDYAAQGASVTVSTTDTLNDIRDAVNGATYADGNEVTASIVDNYLTLEAANTGTVHQLAASDTSGTVLQTLGVLTGGGAFKTTLQSAVNASFTVGNISVTRSRNTGLDDVISGVTLNLLQEGAIITNTADNTTGTIGFNVALQSPAAPVFGNGVVARITFRGLALGTSNLLFTKALLRDPSDNFIDVTHVDGSLSVQPSSETSTPTPTSTGTPTPTPTVTTTPPACADIYEPDDSWTQAHLLKANIGPQIRNFHAPGDVDYVKFGAKAGFSYTIRTVDLAPGTDTVVELYDTDGVTRLARNDDDPDSAPASRLDWQFDHDGTYFVRVEQFNPQMGDCSLTYGLQLTSTLPPSTATPTPTVTPITTPQAARIVVSPPFTDLAVGGTTTVDLRIEDATQLYGVSMTMSFDPGILQVEDAIPEQPGVQIAPGTFPDPVQGIVHVNTVDSISGLIDYQIELTPPAPPANGDGLLARITFQALTTGSSDLRFTSVQLLDSEGRLLEAIPVGGAVVIGPAPTSTPTPDSTSCSDAYEPDDVLSESKVIRPNEIPQHHNLHVAGDVDYVKLAATDEDTYTIQTLNLAPNTDTVLTLYDTDGVTILARNDDDPDTAPASRITWRFAHPGTYFLAVEGFNPSLGSCLLAYDLQVTRESYLDPPQASYVFLPMIAKNHSGGPITVQTVPQVQRIGQGQTADVDINITGVNSLYTAEIWLRFDPQILAVRDAISAEPGVQIEPGPFPNPAHSTIAVNDADNRRGEIHYAVLLSGPAPPATGRGKLARVTVEGLAIGASPLLIQEARLFDPAGRRLPAVVAGATVVVEPPTTATSSPTATATLTPSPTNTSTPLPSPTPSPTATQPPQPTNTPPPTATQLPQPTNTPPPPPTATQPPPPTNTPPPAPPTATPTVGSGLPTATPAGGSCRELVVNGGFESGTAGWILGDNPVPPRVTSDLPHSDHQSLLLGLRPPESDVYTYSSVRQPVYIPIDAPSAFLSFWYWPATEELGASATDRQQALVYVGDFNDRDLGAVILNNKSNSQSWTRLRLDLLELLPLRGRTVHLYFNTVNYGVGGRRTWMFLDDISLQVCD